MKPKSARLVTRLTRLPNLSEDFGRAVLNNGTNGNVLLGPRGYVAGNPGQMDTPFGFMYRNSYYGVKAEKWSGLRSRTPHTPEPGGRPQAWLRHHERLLAVSNVRLVRARSIRQSLGWEKAIVPEASSGRQRPYRITVQGTKALAAQLSDMRRVALIGLTRLRTA